MIKKHGLPGLTDIWKCWWVQHHNNNEDGDISLMVNNVNSRMSKIIKELNKLTISYSFTYLH